MNDSFNSRLIQTLLDLLEKGTMRVPLQKIVEVPLDKALREFIEGKGFSYVKYYLDNNHTIRISWGKDCAYFSTPVEIEKPSSTETDLPLYYGTKFYEAACKALEHGPNGFVRFKEIKNDR